MAFVQRLLWDEWNVGHIAKHRVTPEEVEEVCHAEPLVFEAKRGRIIGVGPTVDGRVLAVVLAPEGEGVYYPITARPASKKERRLYEKQGG